MLLQAVVKHVQDRGRVRGGRGDPEHALRLGVPGPARVLAPVPRVGQTVRGAERDRDGARDGRMPHDPPRAGGRGPDASDRRKPRVERPQAKYKKGRRLVEASDELERIKGRHWRASSSHCRRTESATLLNPRVHANDHVTQLCPPEWPAVDADGVAEQLDAPPAGVGRVQPGVRSSGPTSKPICDAPEATQECAVPGTSWGTSLPPRAYRGKDLHDRVWRLSIPGAL